MSGSFIEQARRRQVVEAAIAVLAREGYARASLSQIAKQAKISKSIITYHFTDKDDLFAALFAHVIADAGAFIMPFLARAKTAPEQVAAYIEAQLAYMENNRDSLLAIGALSMGHIRDGVVPDYIANAEAQERDMLIAIFEAGQRDGHFRRFDMQVMAQIVAKSVEAALTEWAWRPETDLKSYGAELVALFARAMRAAP